MKKRIFALLCALLLLGLCACGSSDAGGASKGIHDFATDMPADEILAAVKAGDWVVTEDSRVSAGEERMHAFYDACMRGEAGTVKIAAYYTLNKDSVSAELYAQEKDSYPRIFLTELSFDGKEYHVVTRYSIEAEPEIDATYPYLKRFQGDAPTPYARFNRYDRYVLTENDWVTMEDIERSMVSSTAALAGDIGGWKSVYTNFIGEK